MSNDNWNRDEIAGLTAQVTWLQAALDQERARLVTCGVAAIGGTSPELVAKKGGYDWSPAYQAVLDLRRAYDAARDVQDKVIAYKEELERVAQTARCSFCGVSVPKSEAASHMLACDQHPMATLRKENERLLKRQAELHEALVKVTRETPYAGEADECRKQRATLIAEVGTLRAELTEAREAAAIRAREHRDRAARVLDLEAELSKVKFLDAELMRAAEATSAQNDTLKARIAELEAANAV